MRDRGVDWMLGDLGPRKTSKKLVSVEGVRVTSEEVDAVLADVHGSGKKLRSGIDAAVQQLEALKSIGLTGEALVLLVTEKCRPDKNGNPTSAVTVQRVLEGLFRLGEYVR